jgi:MFS family permease
MLSVLAASCGGLAISTMGAELFPTEVRGTSNGMLLVVSVTGSATGLLLAGALSDNLGGIGRAIALCAIPTIIAAALFVPRLPEPAGKSLDEISPTEEDPTDEESNGA